MGIWRIPQSPKSTITHNGKSRQTVNKVSDALWNNVDINAASSCHPGVARTRDPYKARIELSLRHLHPLRPLRPQCSVRRFHLAR